VIHHRTFLSCSVEFLAVVYVQPAIRAELKFDLSSIVHKKEKNANDINKISRMCFTKLFHQQGSTVIRLNFNLLSQQKWDSL